MGAPKSSVPTHLLEARSLFGKAFCKWRKSQSLGMTNIHEWARDKRKQDGITTGPHNSQIAFLERGDGFDPRNDFWESLETFNFSIADKDEKFTYVQSKTVRERLVNATPFLNEKGNVADFIDFVMMSRGRAKINVLYLEDKELTADFIKEYFETSAKAFDQVARENVMSRKDAFQALLQTEAMQAVTEQEFLELANDVLRGENYPTPDQVRYAMGKYKDCPMCLALIVLAGHHLPELEEIHEKLKRLTGVAA